MRVLELLDYLDIIQLDVQELVDGFESAANLYVVLELDGHLVVHERLEKTLEGGSSACVIPNSTM